MKDFDVSDLVAAASRLQRLWTNEGFDFCFIGGLAVNVWGQPRHTNDVDATVWTDFGNERPIVDQLLLKLTGRMDAADEFAMLNRVLLVQESGGIDVDISLAAFPFERALLDRARPQQLRGEAIKMCGPSDLVILKAFANRPHDWTDIRGVLVRSGSQLDWSLIESEVQQLAELKEEPEIITRLTELRKSTSL